MRITQTDVNAIEALYAEVGGGTFKAKFAWEWAADNGYNQARVINLVRQFCPREGFGLFTMDHRVSDSKVLDTLRVLKEQEDNKEAARAAEREARENAKAQRLIEREEKARARKQAEAEKEKRKADREAKRLREAEEKAARQAAREEKRKQKAAEVEERKRLAAEKAAETQAQREAREQQAEQ